MAVGLPWKRSQSSALRKRQWGDERQAPFLPNPWVLPASVWGLLRGSQTFPCVLPKLSLFAVHPIRCLFMGKLRKMAPEKGRLASGEVNGKFQGSQEAQVGSETKRRWGAPFPTHPNRTTPWLERPVSKRDILPSWAQQYSTQIPHQGERPSLC